jgi:hypothetical protein
MKIFEIVEASFDNIEFVRELAHLIVSRALLDSVERGTNRKIVVGSVPGFDEFYKRYSEEPKLERTLHELTTTEILFVNDPDYEDPHYGNPAAVGGYHDANNNLIVVFIYNRGIETYYWTQLKKQIEVTLVHEFRHLVQSTQYGKYYNSPDSRRHSYQTRHIELDATWTDLVTTNPPKGYQGMPGAYADVILAYMKQIKELDPKREKLYRRKTIAYASTYFKEKINRRWQTALKKAKEKKYFANNSTDFINWLLDDLNNYVVQHLGRPLTKKELSAYQADARRAYTEIKRKNAA